MRFTFSLLCACFLPFTMSNAFESTDTSAQLESILVSMGFEFVEVNGCHVDYSIRFAPSLENSGSIGLSRHINFSNLPKPVDFQVEEVNRSGDTSYLLFSNFDEGYSHRRAKRFFEFSKIIKREIGGDALPHPPPGKLTDRSRQVEYYAQNFFRHDDDMDKLVSFSRYGPITRYPEYFHFSYFDKQAINKFKELILLLIPLSLYV